MSKKELQHELADLGEDAPEKWTKLELRSRITELREESDLPEMGKQSKTPLQLEVQALNKASRKKEGLKQYAENVLKLPLSGHETTPQIQAKAMRHLYKTVPAVAGDYVGFGKHASLQYVDLLDYPAYTNWLLKTFEEEPEADPRLKRVAAWLLENKDKPRRSTSASEAAGSNYRRETQKNNLNTQGYEKETSPGVSPDMVQNLMQTIEALKSEVAELKGERPRKTRESTEDKSL
jgi:uncharacterized small protein (DUF1192 family)